MKEYNKEKIHEYAKELFALCLENGVGLEFSEEQIYIYINGRLFYCYLTENLFGYKNLRCIPIWELIEKVKQL